MVVELYTSQGCSSCPPADAMLEELAKHDGVIPLALHVDYWDYIGWKDTFADPEHTQRQKRYARASGERMLYTPQLIVGGTDRVVGTKPMQLMDIIDAHEEKASPVKLELSRKGGQLGITAEAHEAVGAPVVIQLVRFDPHESVAIKSGENAGRLIDYTNIVTSWQTVAGWDGSGSFEGEVPLDGDAPAVVIIQLQGPGEILAAARVQ